MVKNIVFDFGDVFINLDKSATVNRLKNLVNGFENSPKLDTINKQYEKGLLSSGDFINFYLKEYPSLSRQEFIDAWNAVLLDFPEYRLTFIEELANRSHHKLFLLSNTNELHIDCVKHTMYIDRFNRFKNCFDKFYLSHEINLRKPDVGIYHYLLKNNNLKAEETLFIDDLKENTEAAEAINIKTWNIIPGREDVVDLFLKNLL